MPSGLRPIGHEDKLTLVDHLTELRKRLLISAVTLVAAFSFCFWQNNAILDIVTKPVRDTQNLQNPSTSSKDPLEQAARYQKEEGQALRTLAPALTAVAKSLEALGGADNVSSAQRAVITRSTAQLATASRQVARAAEAIPTNTQRNLVTLGVTEPFTATITIAFYASLLLAMPMLLFQAYAFVLPAFSPGERKVALPLMLMVPALFVMGAAFGYFVVLERAVSFLQNFNDDSFDILLQAKDYFKLAVLLVAGVGVLFQIPVGVLAVTRLGIFTPKQLAKNRGYVILGIAVLAAVATPTPDPFTMSLAMAPLIVLFELSIVLARWINRIKPASAQSRGWSFGDEGDDDGDEFGALPLDEPLDAAGRPLDDPGGGPRLRFGEDDRAAGDEPIADAGDEPDDDPDDPSKLDETDRKD
jgi:sec-independent protein translocase protein TatC